MKGLRKVISPFAPDQSGASAVLYALGGIIVICDAGGCAGNICGFDEPRWFTHKSAIFSAGLRDMDAILGRDDRLVEKLRDTAEKVCGEFAAVIGTPVPAVIATDYRALRRMAEKKTGLPVIAVDTDGMELYDVGEEKAYLALMQRFAEAALPVQHGRIGVLGLTPLDFGSPRDEMHLRDKLQAQGWKQVWCYGNGSLEEIRQASSVEKNLVLSPAGLKAAEFLRQKFGTPNECTDPLAEDALGNIDVAGKRVLVVHQQVRANTIRTLLEQNGAEEVTVATWFLQKPELKREGDIRLTEEDQLQALLEQGNYDLLIGDKTMWAVAPSCTAQQLDLIHFAVSGRTEEPWTE